jgi:nitrate/TMAO reductase-like tetraheme cytochrome c subunit
MAKQTTTGKHRQTVSVGSCGFRAVRCMQLCKRFWWVVLIVVAILLGTGFGVGEYATSRPSFCGSCHVMESYYDSWEHDVHSKEGVLCVDCHYAPGQKTTIAAKLRGLSQLSRYVAGAFGETRPRGHVSSDSCATSECHPSGSFETNELTLNSHVSETTCETIKPFTHEPHFGELDFGSSLQCATCHEHRAGEEHLATYKQACYLCHFNQKQFNTERASCLSCHEVPDVVIHETADANPITHQVLIDRGTSCVGCHRDVVHGGGPVFPERCKTCHDQPDMLQILPGSFGECEHETESQQSECETCKATHEFQFKMHKAHVEPQAANCFDCHLEISHQIVEQPLRANLDDCRSCHHNTHDATLALLEGRTSVAHDAEVITPFLMGSVNAVCDSCHIVESITELHATVNRADNESCSSCHGSQYKAYDVAREVANREETEALELANEARVILQEALLPESDELEFAQALDEADNTLDYVRAAGAMHNPKTASELLNGVMDVYEDTIDAITKIGSEHLEGDSQ